MGTREGLEGGSGEGQGGGEAAGVAVNAEEGEEGLRRRRRRAQPPGILRQCRPPAQRFGQSQERAREGGEEEERAQTVAYRRHQREGAKEKGGAASLREVGHRCREGKGSTLGSF